MRLLPKGRYVHGSEWLTHCYSCGREKFYWNVVKEVGVCHRCKVTVVGTKQLAQHFSLGYEVAPLETTEYESPPPGIYPVGESDTVKEYLYGRFFTDADIHSCGLFCYGSDIYCPISPLSPEYPISWVRRSISSKGWYVMRGTEKKHYAYGWGELASSSSMVAFVEGVFDALPNRLGIPTVAILGSAVSRPLVDAIEASSIKTCVTAFDPDEAGKVATRNFKREIEVLGLRVISVDLKVEMGDMGAEHHLMRKWRSKLRAL